MKKGNFINRNKLQAVSGLVIAVCFLVKIIVVQRKIGNAGTGFYMAAFAILMAAAMLLAKTLREILKRAVSYRKSRGQYKNALKMMRTGAIFALLSGFLLVLFVLIFAGRMTNAAFHMGAYGTFPMIMMAFSVPFLLFCYSLLGCFDGFFFEVAEGAAKIIFAVTNLLFGIAFVFLFCMTGKRHAMLLHDDHIISAFGAIGAAAGFTAASIITAVWMICLVRVFYKKMRTMATEDMGRNQESFWEQLTGLISAAAFPFLKYFALFGAFIVNQLLFFKHSQGIEASAIFGSYLAKNCVWFILPVAMTVLLGDYFREYLQKVMKKDDIYHAGMRIIMGVKQYLCVILPMICIIGIVFPCLNQSVWKEAEAANALPAILFFACFCLALLFDRMLSGIGKERIGMICALAAFFVQILAAGLLFTKKCTVDMLLYSNLIFALVFLFGCLIFIIRFCVYKKNRMLHLLLPFGAVLGAVLTAVLCLLLRGVIGNIPAALIALFAAAFVHVLVLVVSGCIKENEIQEFPQSGLLTIIGRALGIYNF